MITSLDHHLHHLGFVSGGFHLGQGSTMDELGAQSSGLPISERVLLVHSRTPVSTHWLWQLSR